MSLESFFDQLQSGNTPSLEESMKYEGLRLATFHKRPRAYNAIPASKLAHAGFYYTGENDAVSCFVCGLCVENWASLGEFVDPTLVHRQRSPHCAFLSDANKENIPYTMDYSQLSLKAKQLTDDISSKSQTRDQKESLRYMVSTSRTPPINATPPQPPPPQPPPIVFDSASQNIPNYKDEQSRLDTFTYWPNGTAIRPAELAKAGFYYLGSEDRVQCAFCKGVLRNWALTDRASEEHKKHFPGCSFVLDPMSVGNVSLVDHMSGVQMRRDLDSNRELEQYLLGILTERAFYPDMSMTSQRVNTYIGFYSDSKKSAEHFAEAGFFYTGHGDNVKCFFCDGGLRNWERNDDPWIEHARWFPKCGYLRMKKGDEYVSDVRQRYAPPGTKKPRVRKLKRTHHVLETEVDVHMRSEIVQDVIQMGYPLPQIREIMSQRLAEIGTGFPNVESLVEAMYEAEEIGQCGSDQSEENTCENMETGTYPIDKKQKTRTGTGAAHVNPFELGQDEKVADLQVKIQKMKDENTCKVCLDNEVNIVFLKCGHLVCCSDCAPALNHCPICRETIRGTIRVFIS